MKITDETYEEGLARLRADIPDARLESDHHGGWDVYKPRHGHLSLGEDTVSEAVTAALHAYNCGPLDENGARIPQPPKLSHITVMEHMAASLRYAREWIDSSQTDPRPITALIEVAETEYETWKAENYV